MTKKYDKQQIQTLERLDDIHKELRQMNEYLDDMMENRKTEKTELSFLLSLVGVGLSVSSLLVRSLSGDSRVLLLGGGMSLLLLFAITSYLNRLAKDRPIPKEIMVTLLILLVTSVYTFALGLGIIQ